MNEEQLKHQYNKMKINLNLLIKEKSYLEHLFKYLESNKIQFEIIDIEFDKFLILKTKSIETEFFVVILDKEKITKLQIDIDDLKLIKKKLSSIRNQKRVFLLFLALLKDKDQFIEQSKYIRFNKIITESKNNKILVDRKISLKKKLVSGIPLGKYNQKNKLNDLTGKDWIKFTKSWFIHNPPPRNKMEILHPAKFPETLIENFIKFFTKKEQVVFDPFLGTGSTIVAAKNLSRSCIGLEISKKYGRIAKSRIRQQKINDWNLSNDNLFYKIYTEDSNNIDQLWKKYDLPLVDLCITSPPYWNQLKRNNLRQKERKEKGLDTIYSLNQKDIGNIDDYDGFLEAQKKIFLKVYNIMKNKSYLILITNNVFYDGKLYPLAYDTAISLSDKWILKDEKIWCQDDKALLPLGINSAWVGNRCHQFCLIFRKEVGL